MEAHVDWQIVDLMIGQLLSVVLILCSDIKRELGKIYLFDEIAEISRRYLDSGGTIDVKEYVEEILVFASSGKSRRPKRLRGMSIISDLSSS
jgi:hypothetical protein